MKLLKLHEADNTSIVVEERLDPGSVQRGHKVANQFIAAGAVITKYGQVIGKASTDIDEGDHVHVHNCVYGSTFDVRSIPPPKAIPPAAKKSSFLGFRREDGRVGTRNYVGIIGSVSCSATVVEKAAEIASGQFLKQFRNIDGIVPIKHGAGCGMVGEGGEGFETLYRTLAGYASHPNFGAVLMIGLGCEVNQLSHYANLGVENFEQLTIQEVGGTRPAIMEAVSRIGKLAMRANAATRSECPISELTLGLQCGGSDAFSAVTCNPALGVASDILVQSGGRSILSETPEIVGAEHLLMSRMEVHEIRRLKELLSWWRSYAEKNGASLDNNPSPGNKAGGITTILEKSLGAVAKSGQSRFSSVIQYGERPEDRGLSFMDSPGYDPVSVTGQIASGANLIAFTTGRGSCFGSKPAPTVKLSSTTPLYDSMREDIDLDCGQVISGNESVGSMGLKIFERLIEVASGQRTKSEENGLGDHEFEPWRIGAVL